jgi:hypothetical protein
MKDCSAAGPDVEPRIYAGEQLWKMFGNNVRKTRDLLTTAVWGKKRESPLCYCSDQGSKSDGKCDVCFERRKVRREIALSLKEKSGANPNSRGALSTFKGVNDPQ